MENKNYVKFLGFNRDRFSEFKKIKIKSLYKSKDEDIENSSLNSTRCDIGEVFLMENFHQEAKDCMKDLTSLGTQLYLILSCASREAVGEVNKADLQGKRLGQKTLLGIS